MAEGSDGFLGTGWGYDFARGGVAASPVSHSIAEASGEEKIRQSIWLILSTAPGERIGRPDFGCGVHDLVFATRTAGTFGEIARAVSEALQKWEPRIDVLDVSAQPHPGDALGILVDIHYRVRATNSRVNLVYPFYISS
jgi:uncharacterized protein